MLLAAVLLLSLSAQALASTGGGAGTEHIIGVVYDELGLPKEGALVRVEGSSLGVSTDAGGRFVLSGTDLDGAGEMVVVADGYMLARVPYTLEDGHTLDRSIYLVEEQEPPGTLEGRVRAFDVIPVSRALVTLRGPDTEVHAAFTDADGRYSLMDLPPSPTPYAVSAEASGYDVTTLQVIIEPGRTSSLDLALKPQHPMELVHGTVVDGQGHPLPGVELTVEGSQSSWTTDIDGNYRALVDGRLGSRDLTFRLEGYGTRTDRVDIREPGVEFHPVTMTLEEGGGPETLWVQVLDGRTGVPVAGASVSIEGNDTPWASGALGIVIVNGDGLDGILHLTATKGSYTMASIDVEVEDGGTRAVKLYITRNSNAVLLEGTVVDLGTGAPVPSASVDVFADGVQRLTMTDAEGAFSLYNLPPVEDAEVTVVAPGYRALVVRTMLREFEVNRLHLLLEGEGPETISIHGWVKEVSSERPVAGARVMLSTGTFSALLVSDENGEYRLDDIPQAQGPLRYSVDHWRYSSRGGELTPLRTGEVREVTTWLSPLSEPKTVVRGNVMDADGFPVDGASVILDLNGATTETLASDGEYEVYASLEESVVVDMAATGTGYGWHNQTPLVHGSSANRVNFTLPLGPGSSNVLGRVVAESGRPLQGAEVHLTFGGAFHESVLTDDDGTFAFRLVPSSIDPYRLSAVYEGFNGSTRKAMAHPGTTTRYELVVREDITSVETVHGSVVNEEGLPMASVVVRIGADRTAITDPNGTFVLVAEDLEGTWSVSATFPGFKASYEIVEVPPDGTVGVDLSLSVLDERVTTVRGTVLRASDGRPLTSALVRLGWSGTASWTFETPTDDEGSFEFLGVPKAWGGVSITAVAEGYRDQTLHSTIEDAEGNWFTIVLDRVVAEAPEDPAMSETQAKQVGVGVTVTAVTLAAIFLTEVGRVALLGLILVPLYTKIKREKVMDHFIRGRIYEFICQNPGVNYTAIKKQFKLTNGTVTYHLSMLERQEFIRAKQDGIYKRYFANNGGPSASDVEPMSLQLSIARAIRERPGMTQKEIAKLLGSSKQLVSYHVRRMRDEGQLETHRDGRSVRVYPNPHTPE